MRRPYFDSHIEGLQIQAPLQFFNAGNFPTINPVHWLYSHFAVGGYSPLRRLSGMLTAHMTQIAPYNGFTWHPHRGLEIYTYVIDGQLYHEDSTGGRGVITVGEVQRMFSGSYIMHQELNLTAAYARVIQIWFVAGIEHIGISPPLRTGSPEPDERPPPGRRYHPRHHRSQRRHRCARHSPSYRCRTPPWRQKYGRTAGRR